jgi:hypothetical protein
VHRERDPATEPVADVALLILDREAASTRSSAESDLTSRRRRKSGLAGAYPISNSAATSRSIPRDREVRPGLLPLPGFQERAVVQLECGLVRPDQRLALGRDAAFGRRVALVAQGDARLLGQTLDRLGELEVLDVAQEPDRVAALAAAEAVVQALGGRDAERRRLLRVERTQPTTRSCPAFFSVR